MQALASAFMSAQAVTAFSSYCLAMALEPWLHMGHFPAVVPNVAILL